VARHSVKTTSLSLQSCNGRTCWAAARRRPCHWPLAIASRPLARLAGLLIFVLPATFLAIMGPAIILILQNIAAQSD